MDDEHVDPVIVQQFDGQAVWQSRDVILYEVGNYLGGGAAGVVYEAEQCKTREHFALKILNPLGYKMLPPALVRRCDVLLKGRTVPEDMERGKRPLTADHVWWLRNTATRQFVAAYFSEKFSALRELNLLHCKDIWTFNPSNVDQDGNETMLVVQGADSSMVYVPSVPPKYAEFLRRRGRIFREIRNMSKISGHPNVIRLHEVLELVQDSKCTLFLVMELADGGELFDRIKVDCGTREESARLYFTQLLSGLRHCHELGVCHRDLKPENLLLTDSSQGPVLKIADFGFSARFMLASQQDDPNNSQPRNPNTMRTPSPGRGSASNPLCSSSGTYQRTPDETDDNLLHNAEETSLRVLNSVVGSPFYVAPEVLQAQGYDGTKADVWSLGVILYAMLAGNMPFGQELTTCKRFRHFCRWIRSESAKNPVFWEEPYVDYPKWLFPTRFSPEAKSLIVAMLHPNPMDRIGVSAAQRHPWCSVKVDNAPPETFTPNRTQPESSSGTAPVSFSNRSSQAVPSANCPIITAVLTPTPPTHAVSASSMSTKVLTSNQTAVHFNLNHEESVDAPHVDVVDTAESVLDATTSTTTAAASCRQTREDEDMFTFEDDADGCADADECATSAPVSTCEVLSRGGNNSCASTPRNPTSSSDTRFAVFESEHNHPPAPEQRTVAQQQTSPIIIPRSAYTHVHTPPPPAPRSVSSSCAPDLLTTSDEDEDYNHGTESAENTPTSASLAASARRIGHASHQRANGESDSSISSPDQTSAPPCFSDRVKRSTRFLTSVPAIDVLEKVECVLEDCKSERTSTPLGPVGKLEVVWERYRLEVWGSDVTGSPLCSIQIYEVQRGDDAKSATDGLYLVEFTRGQLEIFKFKRFYQWLRHRVSALVKGDYAFKLLESSASPHRPPGHLLDLQFNGPNCS